tara:strand:+ start:9193 stop:9492 length:300 start_codon:yes stop_codon:yes gene_type:complete
LEINLKKENCINIVKGIMHLINSQKLLLTILDETQAEVEIMEEMKANAEEAAIIIMSASATLLELKPDELEVLIKISNNELINGSPSSALQDLSKVMGV